MGYLLNLAASGSKGFDDVQQLRLQQSPSPDNLILVAHCYFAGTNNIASAFAYLIDTGGAEIVTTIEPGCSPSELPQSLSGRKRRLCQLTWIKLFDGTPRRILLTCMFN
jgi:hypothetical protein